MPEEHPVASTKRPRTREYLLLASTLVLMSVCGEVIARFVVPAPLPWHWPQVRFERSASLGFRLVPSQRSYTADKPFQINSIGMRGPERPTTRRPDVRRILILGDSIAFGYGVAYENSFAKRLEDLLNGSEHTGSYEVLDSGVPSINTAQEVTYFRENGIELAPDVVILAVCWNDISEKSGVTINRQGFLVQPGATPSRFDRWTETPGGYEVRNVLKRSRLLYFVLDRLRSLRERFGHSELPQMAAMQTAVLTGRPHRAVDAGWADIDRQLGILSALCASHGIKLLVSILPMPQLLSGRYPNAQYPDRVLHMCEKHGIRCLDLHPVFKRQFTGHTSLFIPYDGDHPNERGHLLIAQSLYSTLREDDIP